MRPSAVPGIPARFKAAQHLPWILFLATTLFFCRGVFEGKILIAVNSDEIKNFIASMAYMHQWGGEVLPLWNTLVMCGHPFGVAAVGSYNWLNLAAIFFEPGIAYSTIKLVGMFLNGLVFYLFLKRKFGVWPALVPAWIWMVVRVELDTGFFMIPLVLLLADLYVERPGRVRFAGLTAALAVFNLNANPQYIIYTYLLLFAYLLWMSRGLPFMKSVLRSILPLIVAAGLTSFFWCRAIEALQLSNRSMRAEVSTLFPTHFLLGIFPGLFDVQGRPDLNFVIPRIFQTIFASSPFTRRVETFLSPEYLGMGAVVAFLFVLTSRGRGVIQERGTRFFFWMAVGVIAYLTFHPVLYIGIVSHIPVLQGMTGIDRLFYYVHLGILVVMARALQEWDNNFEALKEGVRSLTRLLAWIEGAVFAGLLAVGALVRFFHDPLANKIAGSLRSRENPSIFVENFDAFSRQRTEEFFEFFRLWTSPANPHLMVPLVVTAVFLLVLYLRASGRIGARTFRALFLVMVIADLGFVRGFARDAAPPDQVFKDQDAAAFLKQDPDLFRVLAVEDAKTSYHQFFTVPEMNMSYGLAIPDGYQYFSYLQYLRFYEWLTLRAPGAAGGYTHPRHEFQEDLADFLNCKYLLTSIHSEKFAGALGYENVWENEKYRIYRNLDVLPRVFAVRRAVTLPSERAVAEAIQARPERLRDEVLFAGTGEAVEDLPAANRPDEIRVASYAPHEVVLEARMASGGYLVMTDNYFPGWKAEVDGKQALLLKADYTFRAVRLAEGMHTIRMSYDPASMKLGWAITFGTLLGCALFLRRPRA